LSEELRRVFPDNGFIYGGASLCDASQLQEYQLCCDDWAAAMKEHGDYESEDDLRLWNTCVPFAAVGNGDYLGLDVATNASEPPVAYLSHEGESSTLSLSFEQFLNDWEAMSYIGLDLMWLDEQTGYIAPNSWRTDALRQLLISGATR
jgi:hypothetical protein